MKALLIPPQGAPEQVEWDENQIESWAPMVDAETVDIFSVREHGIQGMVGEWSLMNGSPFNQRATWLMLGLGRQQRVCGPLLLMGLDPDSGEATDLFQPFINAALAAVEG